MSLKLKGIHLKSDDIGELHTFANKMGLSKGWFHLSPSPHYDVICPFMMDRIAKFLDRNKKYLLTSKP